MIALNDFTPYMPRFEIEKPPPWNSSGFSLPARARAARSFISLLMVATPFWSAWRMIGVISPPSMATATQISTSSYIAMPSSVQLALAAGTRRSAAAAP